jgi:hypothetical protein
MRHRWLLLGGLLGTVVLVATTLTLGAALPGYSHVRQTVSEIGMRGSPVAAPFAVSFVLISISMGLFGIGVGAFAKARRISTVPAYFVASLGISVLGVALFPSPDSWHNRFGLSSTVGYLSPLVVALSWRRQPSLERVIAISWIAFALVLVSMGLNLAPLFVPVSESYGAHYGLVQRTIFVSYYGWCSVVGVMLFRQSPVGDGRSAE